jgi:hypothetical protein
MVGDRFRAGWRSHTRHDLLHGPPITSPFPQVLIVIWIRLDDLTLH